MKVLTLETEDGTTYTVGKPLIPCTDLIVTKIVEKCAMGDGDMWRYDCYLSDGTMVREFAPKCVRMQLEEAP